MMRAKAAMGFRSVKRVEVKAETTTPGEVRTTTDANGVRVSTTRARRTLPKLEFVVEENGAILHGPQRGLFPYYSSSSASSNATPLQSTGASAALCAEDTGRVRRSNQCERHIGDDDLTEGDFRYQPPRRGSYGVSPPHTPQHVLMKDCVLNDTRATTLAIKYDPALSKYVCGSSIERFSGHTGVCRVLGSKKYPIIPHGLQIGDLLRIGSVGLVVCELNRGPSEADLEALTDDEYQYIRENYLSLPLQQTFRPTDGSSGRNQHHDDECDDEEEEEMEEDVGGERSHHSRMAAHGARDRRAPKQRSGETSDEGESEEDGVKRAADSDADKGDDGEESEDDDGDDTPCGGNNNGGGAASRKKSQRARNKEALSLSKEKRFCYICYDTDEEPEENPLVAPCNCKGDTKYVHLECLQRWNNNLDADGSNPNHKMCAVTNTDGLDVCSICKGTYLTSVKMDDGRVVSLMAKKLAPPYVTFAVVTQHEARSRSTTLTNTRFQLSFANIPRGQEFLTIGRSTTNNMTLRYRTVSQLHAKVKFEDNNFYLYDASSSNGTMLFLSKPLELDWNKTAHVKIGRTILTLKSKKRWKWGIDGEDESVASPRPSSIASNQPEDEQGSSELSGHRFERRVSDPSAELLSSPYATALRQPLNRTFTLPQQQQQVYPPHPFSNHTIVPPFDLILPPDELFGELDAARFSELMDEASLYIDNATDHEATLRRRSPAAGGASSRPYPDLPASATTGSNIPRLTSRYVAQLQRHEQELAARLAQLAMREATSTTTSSPTNRLSAPGRFESS